MDITERLWSIQDAASYLHIAEKTVSRMIQRGELPAVRLGGQWRFVPEQLSEWLHAKGSRPDSLRDLLRIDPLAVPIDRLLHPDRIVTKDDSPHADAVLQRLAEMVGATYPTVDPEEYKEALQDREDLASTSLGGGLAIPHIRRIEDNPPESMDIFTIITQQPVRYGGGECSLFCLVVTNDLVLHLRILQKIGYVLRKDGLVETLQSIGHPDDVIARVLEAERNI